MFSYTDHVMIPQRKVPMNGNPIEYIQWSVLGKQNTIQRVLLICIWGLISGFDKKGATELYKKKRMKMFQLIS